MCDQKGSTVSVRVVSYDIIRSPIRAWARRRENYRLVPTSASPGSIYYNLLWGRWKRHAQGMQGMQLETPPRHLPSGLAYVASKPIVDCIYLSLRNSALISWIEDSIPLVDDGAPGDRIRMRSSRVKLAY